MIVNINDDEHGALRKALHEYRANKNMLVIDFVELFIGEIFKKTTITQYVRDNLSTIKINIEEALLKEFPFISNYWRRPYNSPKKKTPDQVFFVTASVYKSLSSNTKLTRREIGEICNRGPASVTLGIQRFSSLIRYPDVREIYDKVTNIILNNIKPNLNVRNKGTM